MCIIHTQQGFVHSPFFCVFPFEYICEWNWWSESRRLSVVFKYWAVPLLYLHHGCEGDSGNAKGRGKQEKNGGIQMWFFSLVVTSCFDILWCSVGIRSYFCFQSKIDWCKSLSVWVCVCVPRKRFLSNYWSHHCQTWHGNCLRHENASHVNYIDLVLYSRSHRSYSWK